MREAALAEEKAQLKAGMKVAFARQGELEESLAAATSDAAALQQQVCCTFQYEVLQLLIPMTGFGGGVAGGGALRRHVLVAAGAVRDSTTFLADPWCICTMAIVVRLNWSRRRRWRSQNRRPSGSRCAIAVDTDHDIQASKRLPQASKGSAPAV